MNAYSVDANGIVMVATKNVERKVAELLKAQEELTITKLLASIRNMQRAGETLITPTLTQPTHQCLPANAKATKTVRFKKTGFTMATEARKQRILNEWKNSTFHAVMFACENPTFNDVEKFVRQLGKQQPNKFEWCLRLSQVSILGVYNFVIKNLTK